MEQAQTILNILTDLTGTDLHDQLNVNLFDAGLLDSMATVQLVMELEEQCHVSIPISEFDRTEWETPAKIIAKVGTL